MSPEIIIKLQVDNEDTLLIFKSVSEAAKEICSQHKDDPINYVMLIERTAFDVPRGYCAKHDFEYEWTKIEEARLTEKYHDERGYGDREAITLTEYLNCNVESPIFVDEVMRAERPVKQELLEAAE